MISTRREILASKELVGKGLHFSETIQGYYFSTLDNRNSFGFLGVVRLPAPYSMRRVTLNSAIYSAHDLSPAATAM